MKNNIDVLLKLYEIHRSEYLDINSSANRLLFLTTTLIVAFITIFFSKESINFLEINFKYILFLLSEFIFFLLLYRVFLSSLMNQHRGYILTLEEKIKEMINESTKILYFESDVVTTIDTFKIFSLLIILAVMFWAACFLFSTYQFEKDGTKLFLVIVFIVQMIIFITFSYRTYGITQTVVDLQKK